MMKEIYVTLPGTDEVHEGELDGPAQDPDDFEEQDDNLGTTPRGDDMLTSSYELEDLFLEAMGPGNYFVLLGNDPQDGLGYMADPLSCQVLSTCDCHRLKGLTTLICPFMQASKSR
jgi:hypothetical protein